MTARLDAPTGEASSTPPARRGRGAWIVFRLLHLGALAKDWRRGLLTVLGVAAGVALAVSVTVLQQAVTDPFHSAGSAVSGAAPAGAVEVTPKVQGALPAAMADEVAAVDGVTTAVPVLRSLTPLMTEAGEHQTGALLIGAPCVVEAFVGEFGCSDLGDAAAAEPEPDQPRLEGAGTPVAVSSPVATSLELGLGDTLRIPGGASGAAQVAVVFAPDGVLAELNGGNVLLTAGAQPAAELAGRPEHVSNLLVVGDGTSQTTEAIREVVGAVATVGEPGASEVPAALEAVDQALGGLIAAGLVVGVLVASATLVAAVEERRSTMATAAAMGLSNRRLRAGLLGEGAVLGVLGGLVGVPVGFVVGTGLVGTFGDRLLAGTGAHLSSAWDPSYAFVGLGVGVVAAVLAMAVPARRIVRAGPLASLSARASDPPRPPIAWWVAAVGSALVLAGAVGMDAVGRGRLPVEAATAALTLAMIGVILVVLVVAPRAALGVCRMLQRRLTVEVTLVEADVRRSAGRFAGTCATLVLGLAIAATFASIQVLGSDAVSRQMDGRLETSLLIQAGQPFDQTDTGLDGSVLDAIGEATGREPFTRWRGVLRTEDGKRLAVGVEGGGSYAAALVDGSGGTDPGDMLDQVGAGRVALSVLAAERLGVTTYDEVELPTTLGDRAFQVVGTFEPGLVDDTTSGDWILTDASTAEELWAAIPVQASVSFDDAPAAARARSQLESLGLGVEVFDRPAWEAVVGAAWARYFEPFAVTGVVVMLAGALGMLNLLLLGLQQRRRERAVFRAVGLRARSERRGLLLQAVILAGCAVAGGVVATQMFVWLLTLTSPVYYGFSLPWGLAWAPLAVTGVLAVVLAVVGALVPLAHADRLKVVAEVAHE